MFRKGIVAGAPGPPPGGEHALASSVKVTIGKQRLLEEVPILLAGDAADLSENLDEEIAPGLCYRDVDSRLGPGGDRARPRGPGVRHAAPRFGILAAMTRAHAYPPELSRYVEEHWPAATAGLRVPLTILEQALTVAYQASMTVEEARPLRFRLLLTPREDLPESGAPNEGVLRLSFDRSRPFNVEELRRLALAVPFETSLIGAWPEGSRLRIWGAAHSGPAWLAPTWGGRSTVPNWTFDPIVHVTGPGEIAVRSAGKLVGGIQRGLLVDATLDVFESEWLPALFAREREEVRAEHDAHQLRSPSPTSVEHSLVGRVAQQMVRRTIQLVRGARHGGMLLMVDPAGPDPEPLRGLRLKYRLEQDEPARRYRSLLLEILDAVAAATSKPSVGWVDFADSPSAYLEKLERRLFELSRAIANLAAVDGAVVLDKRFTLLGFGAEVSAELPAPDRVFRALDLEARAREPEEIENVGTRHRAAYRFAGDHPTGLAVVISQDGGVSFVANREGDVVFWEQSVSP